GTARGGPTDPGTGRKLDGATPGINQVAIDVRRRGNSPRADHAVLRMDKDIGFGAQIVRHGDRHTHTPVDNHGVTDVLGNTPRNLQTVKRPHGHVPTVTTRST